MREKDSVAAYFVQAMIHGLGDDPQRVRAVLEQAGIDPAVIAQPTARVPASAFAALWLIQIRELNDEFFGLDSHGMPPGSFRPDLPGIDSGARSAQGHAPVPGQLRPVPARLSRHPDRARQTGGHQPGKPARQRRRQPFRRRDVPGVDDQSAVLAGRPAHPDRPRGLSPRAPVAQR